MKRHLHLLGLIMYASFHRNMVQYCLKKFSDKSIQTNNYLRNNEGMKKNILKHVLISDFVLQSDLTKTSHGANKTM